MNRTEHLLICLAEEAAEIQQAVTKALRFGLDDESPDRTTTNAEDIVKELHDLIGVVELLDEAGAIPTPSSIDLDKAVNEKKAKVEKYLEYSKSRGTLTT